MDFSVKLTKDPAAIADEDLERLRAVGLSDADIWDAGAICAFFNMSNRMASVSAMRPNREFYTMGR